MLKQAVEYKLFAAFKIIEHCASWYSILYLLAARFCALILLTSQLLCLLQSTPDDFGSRSMKNSTNSSILQQKFSIYQFWL